MKLNVFNELEQYFNVTPNFCPMCMGATHKVRSARQHLLCEDFKHLNVKLCDLKFIVQLKEVFRRYQGFREGH